MDHPCLGRRRFSVGLAIAVAAGPAAAQTPVDREHRIAVDIPAVSEDPAGVPVALSLDHPMEPEHYITSLHVALPTDPVPDKGTFLFTPANGRAAVAFKMRSGAGGTVRVTAECSRHGRFTATRELRVAEGGCAASAESPPDRPRNVQIRLPQALRRGEVADVRVRVEHNTQTGLAYRGGRYVRDAAEIFLKEMLVLVDGARVCEFRMSSAISANPIIRFALRVTSSGTLRVVFTTSDNQRAEASHALMV